MKGTILSVMTLYRYNEHLFDDMIIPEGLDKELVIDNILKDTAELEVLYPDPDYMQYLISVWSKTEKNVWEHLYEAEQAEYNPIENYDRIEHEESNATGTTQNGGADTDALQVSGYDSNDFVNREKRTLTHGASVDTEGNASKDSRIHGNIGVTTSQQMLESELNVRPKLNIIKYIATSFKHNFCLLIY